MILLEKGNFGYDLTPKFPGCIKFKFSKKAAKSLMIFLNSALRVFVGLSFQILFKSSQSLPIVLLVVLPEVFPNDILAHCEPAAKAVNA